MRVKVFLALVCLTLSAAMASAQVPTGTISGRVTDTSGGVLPGVTVTASSPNLQGPREVVTSASGDYVLALLPPGTYALEFVLPGFQTVKTELKVASTEVVPFDVELGVGTAHRDNRRCELMRGAFSERCRPAPTFSSR